MQHAGKSVYTHRCISICRMAFYRSPNYTVWRKHNTGILTFCICHSLSKLLRQCNWKRVPIPLHVLLKLTWDSGMYAIVLLLSYWSVSVGIASPVALFTTVILICCGHDTLIEVSCKLLSRLKVTVRSSLRVTSSLITLNQRKEPLLLHNICRIQHNISSYFFYSLWTRISCSSECACQASQGICKKPK